MTSPAYFFGVYFAVGHQDDEVALTDENSVFVFDLS